MSTHTKLIIFERLIEEGCVDSFKLAWSKFNLNELPHEQLLNLGVLASEKNQIEICQLIYAFIRKRSLFRSFDWENSCDFLKLSIQLKDEKKFLEGVRDGYSQTISHCIKNYRLNLAKGGLKELNPFAYFDRSSKNSDVLIDRSTGHPWFDWYPERRVSRLEELGTVIGDLALLPIAKVHLIYLSLKVIYVVGRTLTELLLAKKEFSFTPIKESIKEFMKPLTAFLFPVGDVINIIFPHQGSKLMMFLSTFHQNGHYFYKDFMYSSPLFPLPDFVEEPSNFI